MSNEIEADGETDKAQRGVAAVDRAFAIIAALEASSMPRNLSEISRATGLYKSTILRLLQSLLDAGYVVRVEESKYALGPTNMQLGLAYERANPLRYLVLPVMQRLVDGGSESPSFHIRQTADERLCLFRVDSRHSTLDRVQTGNRLPMSRGAAGKVLLAFDDAEPAGGPEMDEIRETCFAISLGERDKFCAGVSAPVFSRRNRLLGALSFSGPKERFGPKAVEEMKVTILRAARDLSEELGGRYPV
ncbi:IclR family transcriptional regulator [Jiella pelagia]|uniref:IclR family transcriptional regulator n=1 Tax=Jiella pelagia TaxID=2986949 RepID=A0ABY7C7P7_9HYPH|nr:IclR family transcriptional regulator [Jiella pelagia]WAP69830.1 IclR family transcriptional regulator [Jiella pelagia]